jgi:hypothetical protein
LQSKRNLQLRGCPEDGTRTRRNSAWPDLLLRRVESHGQFLPASLAPWQEVSASSSCCHQAAGTANAGWHMRAKWKNWIRRQHGHSKHTHPKEGLLAGPPRIFQASPPLSSAAPATPLPAPSLGSLV